MSNKSFDAMMEHLKEQSRILRAYLIKSWVTDFAGNHAPSTLYFDCDLCGDRLLSWDARDNHFYRKHKQEIVKYAESKGVDLRGKWTKP